MGALLIFFVLGVLLHHVGWAVVVTAIFLVAVAAAVLLSFQVFKPWSRETDWEAEDRD